MIQAKIIFENETVNPIHIALPFLPTNGASIEIDQIEKDGEKIFDSGKKRFYITDIVWRTSYKTDNFKHEFVMFDIYVTDCIHEFLSYGFSEEWSDCLKCGIKYK